MRPDAWTILAGTSGLAICLIAGVIAANSQTRPNHDGVAMEQECLVQLRSADADFGKKAELAGWKVAARSSSGLNWFLRSSASSCTSARQIRGVEAAKGATTVIVTLEDDAVLPEQAIERLGGVVLNKFQNIHAATVAIPALAADDLRHLPGIKRIRKDYKVSASSPGSSNRPR
jgi:hypothetical protein